MSTRSHDLKFSFASGTNANYIEAMYEQYRSDENAVDDSWRHFFKGYEFATTSGLPASKQAGGDSEEGKVEALINAFRRLGHLSSHLNPLVDKPKLNEELALKFHGLDQVDAKRVFHPPNLGIGEEATLGNIYDFLQETYCGEIGADYREASNIEGVLWLQSQMESCRNTPKLSKEEKVRILDKLVQTEGFERFLQDRYLGQKRFSIEGLDAMIPLLDVVASDGAEQGVEEINLGMAHRGRLNVLANFMGKAYENILMEFEGAEFNPLSIEGDVKYHKGFASEVPTASGKTMRLYLSPNPSHLEAVNPVLEGFCRSRQNLLSDEARSRVMPILIHGDAAVIGQGLVAETLNFARLEAYSTGGTLHIIANNQLGFTANPDESKSCDYASDIAKLIRAPVLHVNADNPEAVAWAAKLAVSYRQKFAEDFVIDLIGYRRHGHNETDEPGFTQPLMYKVIKKHPTVFNLYGKKLEQEGLFTAAEVKQRFKDFRASLQEGLVQVREGKYEPKVSIPEPLKVSMTYVQVDKDEMEASVKTAVTKKSLLDIGKKITTFPEGFTPHPKIVKLFDNRQEMLKGDGAVDWGFAENLAYASCASQGYHVRLSGQDCGRGTFSHRHAVLRDFETNDRLETLNLVGDGQARVDIINSPLSEQGCLGYEFGYSVANPEALVLWEAQFGDFANGAQIITDQFLVASEAKWKQTSSLVLLLPHGYEGQGPEHSSARPERYLQACGNLNIQVANVTTPAQIFHLIRRQAVRAYQKPLVVMTPKSLLRHPKVVSTIEDFSKGGFESVMDDDSVKDAKKVKRVIVCTGKVYYDLAEVRDQHSDQTGDLAIVRVEQLYPFPEKRLKDVLGRYSGAKEIVWTQEEPVNMGAWFFMRARLESLVGSKVTVKYSGRRGSGSTAEGSLKSHIMEQKRIVHEALQLTASIDRQQAAAGK